MEEFLNKLYSYEYFGIYLMIAIAVLVLLFIIVLFFGKKDQKKREIEETKKLQQINTQDAFKEENNETPIEVPKEVLPEPMIAQENIEKDTAIMPNSLTLDTNIVNNDKPLELPKEEVAENLFSKEETKNNLDEPIVSPILDRIEEKPLTFNPVVNEEPDLNVLENKEIVQTPPIVDVPDFNFDEIVSGVEEINQQTANKPTEIFSSVYAPESDTVIMPKIEVTETKDDDSNIELPTLKKDLDKKIDMPVLNEYNLDNITGEEYDINK